MGSHPSKRKHKVTKESSRDVVPTSTPHNPTQSASTNHDPDDHDQNSPLTKEDEITKTNELRSEENNSKNEKEMEKKRLRDNLERQTQKLVLSMKDTLKSDVHEIEILSKKLGQFCATHKMGVELPELQVDTSLLLSLKRARQEKARLLHKLSELAGTRLKHNNPNIADLSDENRPTKLVDRLSELYDNEWTDLFEKIREKATAAVKDKDIICCLRDILLTCYEECHEKADNQRRNLLAKLTSISSEDLRDVDATLLLQINEYQRKTAEHSLPAIIKNTKRVVRNRELWPACTVLKDSDQAYSNYLESCINLAWHTQIQSPPLEMVFDANNKNWFKTFTSAGNTVDYIVWPALLLHEEGPLLAKGIVQFIKERKDCDNKTEQVSENTEIKAQEIKTSHPDKRSADENCEPLYCASNHGTDENETQGAKQHQNHSVGVHSLNQNNDNHITQGVKQQQSDSGVHSFKQENDNHIKSQAGDESKLDSVNNKKHIKPSNLPTPIGTCIKRPQKPNRTK